MTPARPPATFDDCLTAQLQFLGRIQDRGALLITDESGRIRAVSANCQAWLGLPAASLLDQPWRQAFPALTHPSAERHTERHAGTRVHLQPVTLNQRELLLAHHWHGDACVIEFEPVSETRALGQDGGAILSACISELEHAATEEQATQVLMHHIAQVIGYDRVMLLQFQHDWHGKVTAEVLRAGVTGYLQHHFPADDIPANARSLYLTKRQRLIADSRREDVPILSSLDTVVDLTYAELRAVHPAHLAYLNNMGVVSSFSTSILANGELWGLVVCHNLTPRPLSFADRQLCDHLASITSLQLGSLRQLARANARHQHGLVRREVKQQLWTQGLDPEVIQRQLHSLRLTFSAQGAWVRHDGQDTLDGSVPNRMGRRRLEGWLQSLGPEPVHTFHEIPQALADDSELMKLASGLLIVRIPDSPNWLVFFRGEQPEVLTWAGPRPARDGTYDALTPRTSFAAWIEQTRGQATPWSLTDLEAAHELHKLLAELNDYLSLELRSQTDPLTGLGNRARLQRALADQLSRQPPTSFVVMLLDLDRFKPVNDTYGHAAGDHVLIELGHRLRSLLRDTDLLVRLGGDEFALLIEGELTDEAMCLLAQRLLQACQAPITLPNGATVNVSASLGAARYPEHGSDAQTLIKQADFAMYQVKNAGRNGFQIYAAN